MLRASRARVLAVAALLTLAPTGALFAQYNDQWLAFTPDAARIVNPGGSIATQITTDTQQKAFAWGDLNNDGSIDLAIVRKQPASFPGKQTDFLLLNENGLLVDRTAQYASASTAPGDQGFLTPTDSRAVEFADVDVDGWLDVITCAEDLLGTDSKILSHPRVYRNLGAAAGAWLGLRFEDARIPQLLTTAGQPGVPRFCDLAVGDVDGDGAPDLYFTDFDLTETAFQEPTAFDLNDRLLMNDGFGYFSDQTAARMTSQMTATGFGRSCAIKDLNGDGRPDVAHVNYLTAPLGTFAAYNDANGTAIGQGWFNVYSGNIGSAICNESAIADLDNDGRLDVIVGDDAADNFRRNTGTGPSGMATFAAKQNLEWLAGSGDLGFPGPIRVVDLDRDGWLDVFIADVDADLPGCTRRGQLYHNRTGLAGVTGVHLLEEKEKAGSTGWFGAHGLLSSDMTGTFDAAFFDVDGDGDDDMILGRCSGTFVWLNQPAVPACQQTVGPGGPGDATLFVCGSGLATGDTSTFALSNVQPSSFAFVVASLAFTPTPFLGGSLVTLPALVIATVPTDSAGQFVLTVPGGGGPLSVYAQCIAPDPTQLLGYELSNATRLDFLP